MRHLRANLPGTLVAPVPMASGMALSAVAGYLVASGRGSTLTTIAIALVGLVALLRWPSLSLIALLILCQELDPTTGFAGGGSSSLLFLGHQIYYKTFSRVSLLTIVAVVAVLRIALTDPPRRSRKIGLAMVLALGGYEIAQLWIDGTALKSAINQDCRFAVLFGLCFVVGAWARESHEWRTHALTVLRWLFTGMALIGLYLAASGKGQSQGGVNIIFYDSAMAAIAGAVFVAIMLAPPEVRTPKVWWLGGAALLIVLLSSRRNVWAAMIVALLVGLGFARNRARLVGRGLSVLLVLFVIAELFLPSVTHELGKQLSAIWAATQGNAADASTKGHLSDISIGLHAVSRSPITGVGPFRQIPGLVNETAQLLYIHNQILESWLRFGLPGALLTVGAQLVLVVLALAFLRRSAADIAASWAAYLLIIAPISMLTAPFFTTTQRWPAMLGFAAGLIAARERPRLSPPAPSPLATP